MVLVFTLWDILGSAQVGGVIGVDTRNQSVVIWIVIPLCLYMEYLGREREKRGGGGRRKMFKCLDFNYQC